VVVRALRLEEDGVVGVPPEVRDRVAAVAAASVDLQPTCALPIGTGFALLLLPRLRIKEKSFRSDSGYRSRLGPSLVDRGDF
jgi:hypothetical protein